jgi:DtxR family Mn-dependent transcriptional regulator
MPKRSTLELSHSVEDYLKAIYQLTEHGESATTTGIAEALNIAAPSVTGMVKRLAEAGLLEHLPYKGVTLTGDGRRAALRMLRRHRLIEAYLVQRLGYSWDNVHDEAERLEHAVSEGLIERMSRALGDPHFDPHGDPIPTADGFIADVTTLTLPEVAVGETVTISRVESSSAERLRWLADADLVPGAEITVLEHQPFLGPITLRLGAERRIIGHDLALQLHCARERNP